MKEIKIKNNIILEIKDKKAYLLLTQKKYKWEEKDVCFKDNLSLTAGSLLGALKIVKRLYEELSESTIALPDVIIGIMFNENEYVYEVNYSFDKSKCKKNNEIFKFETISDFNEGIDNIIDTLRFLYTTEFTTLLDNQVF